MSLLTRIVDVIIAIGADVKLLLARTATTVITTGYTVETGWTVDAFRATKRGGKVTLDCSLQLGPTANVGLFAPLMTLPAGLQPSFTEGLLIRAAALDEFYRDVGQACFYLQGSDLSIFSVPARTKKIYFHGVDYEVTP